MPQSAAGCPRCLLSDQDPDRADVSKGQDHNQLWVVGQEGGRGGVAAGEQQPSKKENSL